ncbi:MAG: hypothetical protein ACFFAS_00895 [Promethearchaeota archaeon]
MKIRERINSPGMTISASTTNQNIGVAITMKMALYFRFPVENFLNLFHTIALITINIIVCIQKKIKKDQGIDPIVINFIRGFELREED